uniref:N-acetyltransferase domain-containing protein n=1 Tax=Entomoneis paludosa TaxID=265537 RepID=A0A7S2V961_9STRA|mmetsp:Transcript_12800/g.26538  ORF Transcript_12800/g.26538 Transcript_12800/m.26538 type:complete len:288 (+) Transcript_12800:124-987(+)
MAWASSWCHRGVLAAVALLVGNDLRVVVKAFLAPPSSVVRSKAHIGSPSVSNLPYWSRPQASTATTHLFETATWSVQIEQVSSKRRALDALVFRGMSKSAAQLLSEHQKQPSAQASTTSTTRTIRTEQEAIDHLLPGYDAQGNPRTTASPRPVQFVAISTARDSFPSFCANTQGVVGVVRAQIQPDHHSTQLDPSLTADDPATCVYMSNLSVHAAARRRGIGSQLVQAVEDYAQQQSIVRVVLTVEATNEGAIQMYQARGYIPDTMIHKDEKGQEDDEYCTMRKVVI